MWTRITAAMLLISMMALAGCVVAPKKHGPGVVVRPPAVVVRPFVPVVIAP